jgi:HEPN domain-containing protein
MSDPQPPEVTQGWLERARSDLVLGKLAQKTKGVLPEDACFHAQQCAEKAL